MLSSRTLLFSYDTANDYCPYECYNESIQEKCKLLEVEYKTIPIIFKAYIKKPPCYICGKKIIFNMQKSQKKALKKNESEMLKLFAPPKLANLLKEKHKKKEKIKQNVYEKTFICKNKVEETFKILNEEKFICFWFKSKIINLNLGLYIIYSFYGVKNNLLAYMEVLYEPGKKGEVVSFFITDKEPLLYFQMEKY
ncbi:MAG: hypothetical protein ACOCQR_01970 [bacterium]